MPTSGSQLILFYDAICPMCVAAVEKLRTRGLLDGMEARPTSEADLSGLSPQDVDSVRSEMLLRDVGAGISFRGFDALVKLLEAQGRGRLLVGLASVGPVRGLLRFGYRLIAYNRRVLSPPATRGMRCDCDPPARPGWRIALHAALLVMLSASLAIFGLSLGSIRGGASHSSFVLESLGVGAVAWILPSALASIASPGRWRDIFAQGLVASVLGGLVMALAAAILPALRTIAPAPRGLIVWEVLGILAGICRTTLSIGRRHENAGVHRRSTLIWVLTCLAVWTAWVLRTVPSLEH